MIEYLALYNNSDNGVTSTVVVDSLLIELSDFTAINYANERAIFITSSNYDLIFENPDNYKINSMPVAAVGTITMGGIATLNDRFVIDTQIFRWRATRSAIGEVEIGANAAAAVTNLVLAINEDLDTVTASDGAGNTVVVVAKVTGVVGNDMDFSETSINMSMDGSKFLGGTVAGVDEVIVAKPLITAVATWNVTTIDADGVDAATLGAGLPNPTTITVEALTGEDAEDVADFDVADGVLVLKSLVVGTFSISAKASGYQYYTQTITVVIP